MFTENLIGSTKKRWIWLVVGVVVLVLGVVVWGVPYVNKTVTYKKYSQVEPLFETTKTGYYSVQKNEDRSMDYYFMGKINGVSENENDYIMSLSSIYPANNGEIIEIAVPKYLPPIEGQDVIGKNFKEMVARGFFAVKLRIRYDINNKVLEWELLKQTQPVK